jgi:hypothetical protein
MREYKNRYGDTFTFSEDENHDILWQGNFEFCRIGMPNDYKKAYTAYRNKATNPMDFEKFKKEVHLWDDKKQNHKYPQYIKLVETLRNEISMVDPSGGPYISRGMSMESFGFNKSIVVDIVPIDTGYKLIIQKCDHCHQPADKHKIGCETNKIQVNL